MKFSSLKTVRNLGSFFIVKIHFQTDRSNLPIKQKDESISNIFKKTINII